MLRAIPTYLLCALIVFLPACGTMLSAEQSAYVEQRLDELEQAGQITADERAAARAVMEDNASDRTMEDILWTVGSIAGALFGVNVMRGSVNNRKGLPPAQKTA